MNEGHTACSDKLRKWAKKAVGGCQGNAQFKWRTGRKIEISKCMDNDL